MSERTWQGLITTCLCIFERIGILQVGLIVRLSAAPKKYVTASITFRVELRPAVPRRHDFSENLTRALGNFSTTEVTKTKKKRDSSSDSEGGKNAKIRARAICRQIRERRVYWKERRRSRRENRRREDAGVWNERKEQSRSSCNGSRSDFFRSRPAPILFADRTMRFTMLNHCEYQYFSYQRYAYRTCGF